MKKTRILLAFTALVLVSALISCTTAVKLKDGEWFAATRNGKSLYIALEANATTGYQWEIQAEGAGVGTTETDYEVQKHPAGMTGVGGLWTATLSDFQEGTTVLTLRYLRSWEPDSPAQTRTVTVTADSKGTIVDLKGEQNQ